MDSEQRASEIGSQLTNRFRSQLSAFNNYSTNRSRALAGTADAYRTNLIEQMGKTNSGKLMKDMIQGQLTSEGGAAGGALAGLGLKGAKSFYSGRLARQQAQTSEARAEVDKQFPEGSENETGEGLNDAGGQSSDTVGVSSADVSTTDFSGASSGVPGVSAEGSIQVSGDYTQGDDPATIPETTTAEAVPETTTAEAPSLYTDASQTGLSEAGYAQRAATYSEQLSQAPRQVMFDNTSDPPLSDIIDRMRAGDTTLGDSPATAVSQEQAGTRLSNMLDTTEEQTSNIDFMGQAGQETEAISRGAQSIDYGAGPRAITQTELQQARPQPTPQAEPTPEPVSDQLSELKSS